MIRTARRLLVASTAVTLAAIAGAGPAGASSRTVAASRSDCPSGYVCLWTDANFTGSRWQSTGSSSNLPSWINDKASSVFNNGNSCAVRIYSDSNYGGNSYYLPIKSSLANLTLDAYPGGGSWNDRVSSVRWFC